MPHTIKSSHSPTPQLVYNKRIDSATNYQEGAPIIIPYFSLYNDKIILHPRPCNLKRGPQKNSKSLSNLKKAKFQGKLSSTQRRIIKQKLTAWLTSIESYNNQEFLKSRHKDRYPVFLTLTLCSKQMTNDQDVKRKLLDPMIKYLKRQSDIQEYFWRAEKQKNGNIHFHLIVDKYVKYEDALKGWNRLQEKNGYIDKFEEKNGHRTPNSVDVRGCESVDNFINYVIDYAVKDEKNTKVEGRIYGMSDNIKEIGIYQSTMDSKMSEAIGMAIDRNELKIYVKEYFTIITFNKSFYHSALCIQLKKESSNYYTELYLNIYNTNKKSKKVIKTFKEKIINMPKQLILYPLDLIPADYSDRHFH